MLIEFDGTDFCGWAEQPGFRTVKGTLTKCIRQVSGERVDLRGCSRTDSGAHARGFVADFATANAMPAENWAVALNRQLEDDVRILRSEQVFDEFHSRFYARSRIYEYRVAESYKVEPWRARYVYEDGRKWNLEKAERALNAVKGRHDFRAFGEDLVNVENAVREVKRASLRRIGGEVRLRIEATAFIRGMMRRIAGGLFEVALGKRNVKDFESLLNIARRDELNWPVVLPAKGLALVGVRYGQVYRDVRKVREEKTEYD